MFYTGMCIYLKTSVLKIQNPGANFRAGAVYNMKNTRDMKDGDKKGLCYRCEYRARFYEEGHGPRYECQQADMAVCSCYMYKPVTPVVLKLNDNEKRSRYGEVGAMLSGRSHQEGTADPQYKMKELEDGKYVLYVVPKTVRKKKETKESKPKKKDKKS